jgi:ANTAR domain/PAS fold
MRSAFLNYDRAGAFQVSDAPLLVVDTDLVIRDVNPAYLDVTARGYDELVGTNIFEAFPDNPNDPSATGVTNLSASFTRVFSNARRDHMALQRYDIPSADPEKPFVRRFWTPVNSPILDEDGQVIGALHHVEDVTRVAEAVWDAGTASADPNVNLGQEAWNTLVAALAREVLAHQETRVTVAQLQQALSSRIVIEQAKGMIAAREGITIEQAFARLRQHARRNNAMIQEVARAVVELGLQV